MMKPLHLMTLSLGLLIGQPVLACSCFETTIDEKYKKATAVFIGHVVQAKEVYDGPNAITDSENRHIVATYNVVEMLKGTPNDGEILTDGIYADESCAVGMLPGVDYVIFLSKHNTVSRCNGTHIYNPVRNRIY
jgi:hypothetical protein